MKYIPAKPDFEGEFERPGDKSITHRAVMFNGGANGEAKITNALMGEDCLSTCRCMQALGASVRIDGTTIYIKGAPTFATGAQLDCGNSGTTIRLLTGFLSGKGIEVTLFGDDSLSSRPMNRVANPLALLGAEVHTTNGRAPIKVYQIGRASCRDRV